ncbi:patatin-like phospholipase family protein [Coralliovum pocilloporae]|uniref:patatin-like phospholipase family protein n=1 Tax=Coralliovum pocilloporae TaxID=3066369 RepID=UPI00330781BA
MAAGTKRVNLALQGGGAHGAFTWGTLEALLQDGRVEIDGITGTSAGAMNAVVLAEGYRLGGRDGACAHLEAFWKGISDASRYSPMQRTVFDVLSGNWSLDQSPSYLFFDLVSRLASPYDLNPLNLNPLIQQLDELVDFKALRADSPIRLFIAATNVQKGKIRIFEQEELTAKAIMASACLPFIFQAIEIDGEAYWDGGYMGNPPLYPLFYKTETRDTIIVQINPLERQETPRSARDILNRVNEITFNATLTRELRAIDFVTRLIDEGRLDSTDYMRVNLHRIESNDEITPLSASSKLNAEWAFLSHLRDLGYRAGQNWLELNFDQIGKNSTLKLKEEFL